MKNRVQLPRTKSDTPKNVDIKPRKTHNKHYYCASFTKRTREQQGLKINEEKTLEIHVKIIMQITTTQNAHKAGNICKQC